MTAASSTTPRTGRVRLVALATATTVVATACVLASAPAAGAATLPQAQSVGNFLDATLGGKVIDPVLKLKYATAKSPGQQSVQNPLDATVLNAATIPLTGKAQLPSVAGIKLGAVNQVAVAKPTGYAYGASGAVSNSGGVSVGGNNNAYPANATVDLTPAGLSGSGSLPVPVPGNTDASALPLGGITASIGAVAALAKTPAGYGKAGSTDYQIASLDLSIGSPLVAAVLKQVDTQVSSLVTGALAPLSGIVGRLTLPSQCDFTSSSVSVDNGTITIDGTTGTVTLHVAALLKTLGLDLNKLPANTDLLAKVLDYLTSPTGLAKGITDAVNGLVTPLNTKFDACSTAIAGSTPLANLVAQLQKALGDGKTQVQTGVTSLVDQIAGAGGANPLAPIADGLKQVLAVGVNVQPNGKKGTFTSKLTATPKQGTAIVPGQTIVRAIEVDVLGGQGAVVALANAAAGPSTAPATPTVVPTTAIPTAVPAGQAEHGSPLSPLAPIALLLLLLTGAGAFALRTRTRPARDH